MALALEIPRYSTADLDKFPDDGNRYELLDGVLLVTPAPTQAHQLIANRLQSRLSVALEHPGHAHIVGPGAVERGTNTHLEPDILVYPSRFSPMVHWREIKEHWLAVEIFSPSSTVYDRDFKRDAYFALGVQQAWLVDWRNRRVEVCSGRGKFRYAGDVIRWHVPTVGVTVEIQLSDIFAGIESDSES